MPLVVLQHFPLASYVSYHLSAFVEEINIVGFGTGGTLALLEAARYPNGIASVAAVSVPWKFKTSNMLLAHIAYGFEKLTGWVPTMEEKGIFREHPSENPEINYQSVPVRTAYEVHQLHDQLKDNLSKVSCPVLLLQGTNDPIVDSKGINKVFDLIGSQEKELQMIEADNHGILYENIGDCRSEIIRFFNKPEPAEKHDKERVTGLSDKMTESEAE